ncbi:MAG: LysM peptidoglycan-binding domain-containing protein [Cycloclasticus sp.]
MTAFFSLKNIKRVGCGYLFVLTLWPMLSFADEVQPFPRPATLQADVRFWTRIYSEVTTHEGLLHDNQQLNIIYARLSFSPGSSHRARQQSIKKKKAYYKKILLDLATKPHIRLTGRQHKRVKAMWPKETRREEFKAAATRLRFQLGQADRFKQGLVRSGRWLPFIKQEFSALDIPLELASLPHVESSFRSDAKSHAGAAGLWQFTRSTGRRYMRIDQVLDERLDPFLATRAAGLLLKNNHQITGTWPLALTAYNHGAGGMRRAIKATGGTDISKIVREYKGRTFGFASRNFYNAFLAARDIDEQPAKYFGEVVREPAMQIQEIELSSYYTVKGLLTAFGVKNNIFKSLNPALQPTIWSNHKYVPKGYRLRVPVGDLAASSNDLMASIPSNERGRRQKSDFSYRVKRGDTLSKIAQRFKLSSRQLAALNNLKDRHKIRVGQVLRLPHAASQPKRIYQVRRGDNLSLIARKVGVLEADLLSLNKLKNRDLLYVGQRLRLR